MHAVVFATTLAALIAIHAPAAAQTASAPLEKKNYNHSAWTKGIFSEAVTVTGLGAGKLIFLAGVGAEDENGPRGNVRAKADFPGQCQYAYDKIKRVLAQHGAKISDIVKMTSYLTDFRYRPDYSKCMKEVFGDGPLPAHTLLNISHLAFPEMLLEVDVIAVAPQ